MFDISDAISNYDEYLNLLKTNFTPAIKIQYINNDGTVQNEISNKYVDMSGTLSIGSENGTRRTADLTFDNSDGYFSIDSNNVWYGKMVKLWMGLYLSDGNQIGRAHV